MREIFDDILTWDGSGRPFALARVVETWGSSPRRTGAAMIVGTGMEVAGSVSGGCIEGAVITEAQAVLTDGTPSRSLRGALTMNGTRAEPSYGHVFRNV